MALGQSNPKTAPYKVMVSISTYHETNEVGSNRANTFNCAYELHAPDLGSVGEMLVKIDQAIKSLNGDR